MNAPEELLSVIDEALALLDGEQNAVDKKGPPPREPLPSLLKECEAACAALDAAPPEPVRTIHHFACSGGTILSRCLGAMPNTVLLSEIDPFSPIPLRRVGFAPYDLLKQSQTGLRPLDEGAVEETFLAGLSAMYESLRRSGRRLVIRDHTHSHFCTTVDPQTRRSIRDILNSRFTLRSLVTVRHPLDSLISLRRNDWVMFAPDTLEEYCRRYILFLDAYADAPLLRYEDFVTDPDAGARAMADALDLPFTGHWRDLLPAIAVTGDSGRASDEIGPRPRRAVPEDLVGECAESASYDALCTRLGYDPDPGAPAAG